MLLMSQICALLSLSCMLSGVKRRSFRKSEGRKGIMEIRSIAESILSIAWLYSTAEGYFADMAPR